MYFVYNNPKDTLIFINLALSRRLNMNKRIISEAELLLSKNAYMTVNTIATALNCSNKTIRNDLLILEEWLKEFNLTLDKKIGVGIAIRGDESVKLKVLNSLAIKSNFIEEYSPEDRINYILAKLFVSNSKLRIRDLSSSLYVSRATIHKDLLAVEKWLKKYNIKLVRKTNYGTEIDANEGNLREAMFYLICSNKSYLELLDVLINGGKETGISYTPLKIFKDFIDIDFIKLKDTVLSTESIVNYNLSDESLLALLVSVIIIFIRVSSNKYINISEEYKEKLKGTSEFNIATELFRNLEASFSISFPEDEVYNLVLHLLCSKTNNFINSMLNMDNANNNEATEVITIAKALILHWENTIRVPLSQDSELLASLVTHLKPVINGIKYGIFTSNPILDEIFKYYPNTFKVVKDSIYILEAFLDVKINDDEIGYITLHLASAIDRAKNPLKTLLVCHGGTGETMFLRNKLRHEIGELDIVITKSSSFIKISDLEDIDIIISTVPLKLNTEIEIINISPVLNKQDIVRLRSIVKNIYTIKNTLSINK